MYVQYIYVLLVYICIIIIGRSINLTILRKLCCCICTYVLVTCYGDGEIPTPASRYFYIFHPSTSTTDNKLHIITISLKKINNNSNSSSCHDLSHSLSFCFVISHIPSPNLFIRRPIPPINQLFPATSPSPKPFIFLR